MTEVTFNDLPRMMGRTFSDPAGVMRRLMERRFDRSTLWSAIVLVSVLSALSIELTFRITPMPSGQVVPASAMTFALIIGSFMTMLVFAIYYIGQMLGGAGTFSHVLLSTVWFQMIAILLQLAQIVTVLVLPGLLGIVTLIAFGFMVYIWLNLIDTVHGFGSLIKALATLFIAFIGIAVGLAILLTLIGATAGIGAS